MGIHAIPRAALKMAGDGDEAGDQRNPTGNKTIAKIGLPKNENRKMGGRGALRSPGRDSVKASYLNGRPDGRVQYYGVRRWKANGRRRMRGLKKKKTKIKRASGVGESWNQKQLSSRRIKVTGI